MTIITPRVTLWIVGALLAAVPHWALAQTDSTPPVRGVVQTTKGAAVGDANVFVLETLEGALSGADGAFLIRTREPGPVTLVVRRVGFREVRRSVSVAERGAIRIALEQAARTLPAVVVRAGQYTAGDGRGQTLSTLDVVTTPGTAADVARTIQTLPGVQGGDEGNALFVRGGDFTETKVFLNDAGLLAPAQARSPVGTFIGSVDPFLLDGIFFSSGGFGARYGNALSGIASLQTVGVPQRTSATLTAGLGTLSGYGALALPKGAGARAAVNLFDLAPLYRVNGSPRAFGPFPRGRDVSASAAWAYRPTGELKLFGINQRNGFALAEEPQFFSAPYDFVKQSDLAVATWRDVFGRFTPFVSASTSSLDRDEGFIGTTHTVGLRSQQLFASTAWSAGERLTLRAGGEIERLAASLNDHGQGAAGQDTLFALVAATSVRSGLYGEADTRLTGRARLIVGARTDYSTLTAERTVDPRVSVAYALLPGATLTAAWGIYHQLPDPLRFDPVYGDTLLPPIRATQAVLGAQIGAADDATMARVEVYSKRYSGLVQTEEFGEHEVYDGGTGTSRGVDVFLKGNGPWGSTGRLTYSHVAARRSYGPAGVSAPASFDVPHTVTAVVQRTWGSAWRGAVAYRYATGRPYSQVIDAEFDSEHGHWLPVVSSPRGARLQPWQRIDLSASYIRRLSSELQGIAFVSLTNALGRANVHEYLYSVDFSKGAAVPSVFSRSVYFGASLTRTR